MEGEREGGGERRRKEGGWKGEGKEGRKGRENKDRPKPSLRSQLSF